MKRTVFLFLSMLICVLPMACTEAQHDESAGSLTPNTLQPDSISFLASHHYWEGDNFNATDTIRLLTNPSSSADTLQVLPGADSARVIVLPHERIVVAEIYQTPSDSLRETWVRLVSENYYSGWLQENDFLQTTVPDSSISQFLYLLSHWRAKIGLSVLLLTLMGLFGYLFARFYWTSQKARWLFLPISSRRLMGRRIMPRRFFYALLTLWAWIALLVAYHALRLWQPSLAAHYYFHPELNFFHIAPSWLTLVLMLAWTTVITFLCAFLEMFHTLAWHKAALRVLQLTWILLAVYWLLISIPWHGAAMAVGVALFAITVFYATSHIRFKYVCGSCGREIDHLGRCPHCGKINV